MEGGHWQMAPAYLATVLLSATAWSQSGRFFTVSVAILLCIAAGGLSYLIPMFSLPKPTGPYQVGTRIQYMRDDNRREEAAPEAARNRELMVQVWYPSIPSSNTLARYRQWGNTKLRHSYQAVLRTNSRVDAPVAEQNSPFPVLLFGHGWGGTRVQNTFLAEDLASHGYVVVAIDHTYNASRVAFPDGRVIDEIPGSPIIELGTMSPEGTEAFWNRELAKWTADQIFVLNRLQAEDQNPASIWYRHLNMSLVGAFGHSFGGSAALRVCNVDPRVKSAINMDGWTFDGVRDWPVNKSMMFMFEEDLDPQHVNLHSSNLGSRVETELNIVDNKLVIDSLERAGGYRFTITGAMHGDFTDQPMISPLRRITHTGPIDRVEMQTIVRDYTLAFFDQTLRGRPSPLLNSGNTSPFREIQFRQWPKPVP
jgi:predicted dienelactone hydrolase